MIEYRKTAVTYQGDGNTSVFPFSFAVTDANSVRVSIYDKETDVSTELTRDYFVDMTAHVVHYPGYAPGEPVDAHAQPPKLPRGRNITIYRVTPINQLVDLGNKYPLPYIEAMADKVTAILQEHDEMLGRAIMSQKGSGITPRELIDSIFHAGEKTDAAMNAAQQSASAAAGAESAAKGSEAAAREMAERMNTVLASVADEIKQKLSAEYVPQTQGAEMRTAISNASIAILQRSRAYQVGDIAYHKALPSWARLECVTAGTTGSNANVFSKNVKAGQYIIDGGVRWIVDDVRDCNRVGSVTGALYLPDGYIKANGATVNRADYPRLVTLANKYNLWTSDSTGRDLGLFGRADGSTTMVLPNWIDRMLQFSDCNNGTEYGWAVKAGLPNIEGYITSTSGYGLWWGADGGVEENQKEEYNPSNSAIQLTNEVRRGHKADSSPYPATKKPTVNNNTIRFNAALNNPIYGRSNTVQPAAIQLFPIIKY